MGTPRNGRTRQRRETERYRKALEAALESLDWTIDYLHSIRKSRVAEAVAKNRKAIARRLQAR